MAATATAAFRRTAPLLGRSSSSKARIVLPQLSPTHTRAKIVQWGPKQHAPDQPPARIDACDILCVVQCSADVVQVEHRTHEHDEPLMLIESQDEGDVHIFPNIRLHEWYNVGTILGELRDPDDNDDDSDQEEIADWLWQAYTYDSKSS